MQSKLISGFILFLVAAISGGIIFFINDITAPVIAQNLIDKQVALFSEAIDQELVIDEDFIYTETDINGLTEYVLTTPDGETVIGYVYSQRSSNNYGDVDVMVGIIDGVIQNVVIVGSTNTPTFVKNIEKNYLEPFKTQSTTAVEFDSKTGATYTYTSVSQVVTEAVNYYNETRGDAS